MTEEVLKLAKLPQSGKASDKTKRPRFKKIRAKHTLNNSAVESAETLLM